MIDRDKLAREAIDLNKQIATYLKLMRYLVKEE